MKKIMGGAGLRSLIALLAIVLLSAGVAGAAPTTPEQAKTVVMNWLAREAAPMGAPLGETIREVQTVNGRDGNPAYYVVCLNPSGLVFLPADDRVEPIIGFVSGATAFDPNSRLGKLVNGDIPGRVLQARTPAREAASTSPSNKALAQSKWALLGGVGPLAAAAVPAANETAPGAGEPVISAINPIRSAPGNLTVILTGSNFTGTTSVTCFPQVDITWTVDSDTQITIKGNFPSGGYNFTVQNAAGSFTSDTLWVGIAPRIYYINPLITSPGTIHVTLTGINLSAIEMCSCSDESIALTWNIISDTVITIDGAFPIGTYTFTVSNPFGAATSPAMTVGAFGRTGISDVRVAPFIQTSWGSTTVDGYQLIPPTPYSLPCYDYFTPPYPAGGDFNFLNYPCGTTAAAELMYFWQYPTAGVGTNLFTITVNGGESTWPLRGGDGLGGPYQWSLMPKNPAAIVDPANPQASDLQRQAIGTLTHDIDLTLNMDYEWNYTTGTGYEGANKYRPGDLAHALTNTFKYGNAVAAYNEGKDIPYTNRDAMIIPNLLAGYPVFLAATSIEGSVFTTMLCDGYGYNYNSIYHHLHLGYGYGAWYNLPLVFLSINDPEGQFTILTDIVYNVYPSGSGEIIAGRVLDSNGNPLAGAVVTAAAGGKTYNAVAPTDAHGAYAIPKVPGNTTFTVTATRPPFAFAPRTVATGVSLQNSITTGNLRGIDFYDMGLNQALDNNTLAFLTGGNSIWYKVTDVWHFGGSSARSGAIDISQTSWLQTTVSGPGQMTFWFKVSADLSNWLRLYLDGVRVNQWSGQQDWTQYSFRIPAGNHTVRWSYEKNATGSGGSDCAWLDQVSYVPDMALSAVLELLLLE